MSQRARAHAARLIASAEEALDIARGKQVPTRAYTARDVLVEAPPAYTAGQIREIRDAIRVSQQVFAQMLNVSDKTVRAWEQGARVPDGPTLRLLELAQHDPEALLRRVIGRRDRGSAADLRRGQRVPGEPRSRTGRSEGARKSARKGR